MERAKRRERGKEESEMGFVGRGGDSGESGGMGTRTEAWANGRRIHTQRIHYVTLTETCVLLLLLLLPPSLQIKEMMIFWSVSIAHVTPKYFINFSKIAEFI